MLPSGGQRRQYADIGFSTNGQTGLLLFEPERKLLRPAGDRHNVRGHSAPATKAGRRLRGIGFDVELEAMDQPRIVEKDRHIESPRLAKSCDRLIHTGSDSAQAAIKSQDGPRLVPVIAKAPIGADSPSL